MRQVSDVGPGAEGDLSPLAAAVALLTHHDAITGTEKCANFSRNCFNGAAERASS